MRNALIVALALSLTGALAHADIVYMKDGTTREGRVVSQTQAVVVLEVTAGGVQAKITLPRENIDRIERKPTLHQALMAERDAKLATLKMDDTDAVVAFANWCVANKLYDDAEAVYEKLIARDDAGLLRGRLELARIEFDRRRTSRAKEHLDEIFRKNPEAPEAKALQKEIVEFELKAVERLLSEAVDEFNRRKYDAALDDAESFHEKATDEQKKHIVAATTLPEGMDFATFVAEARLRRPCKACENGAKACPTCKGKTVVAGDLACPGCGGSGLLACDDCRGTGFRFDKPPDWELPGMVKGLERRVVASLDDLKTMKKTLTGRLDADAALPTALRAVTQASRALGLLEETSRMIAANPEISRFPVNAERAALLKDIEEIMRNVAKTFDDRADAEWKNAKASDEGMLACDTKIRGARNDAARAGFFYRSIEALTGTPPADVKAIVARIDGDVAEMDKTIDHNAKLVKAFEITIHWLKKNDLAKALAVMVEIVANASKADLAEISKRVGKEVNFTLPDLMAHCRFELGKEKADFGETTAYERPAFVKKLLHEAAAAAVVADEGYRRMLGFRDSGRRNNTPAGLVRDTRECAQNARAWYRAVLKIPYPLALAKRKEIDEQIEYLDSIIAHCNGWFKGGTSTTTPVP